MGDSFLDEAVDSLYSDPDILVAMEQMDEDVETTPQECGVHEATLFDF